METKREQLLAKHSEFKWEYYHLRVHLDNIEKILRDVEYSVSNPSRFKNKILNVKYSDIYEYIKSELPLSKKEKSKINFKNIKEIYNYLYNDRKITHDKIRQLKKKWLLIKKQLNATPCYDRCPKCTRRKLIGSKCKYCRG
jgi:lysine/ornithine N-monooxygenase